MSRREFNVAGPCVPGEHYMLDPMRGIGDELMDLVDGRKYFVIHAARQSGKTTLLKELARQINKRGEYYALYCSLESVDGLTEPEKGIPAVVKTISAALNDYNMPNGFAVNADYGDVTNVLKSSLAAYCKTLNKPLTIFFDEADCLSNGTLVTFLRQLRNGYISRPEVPFVHSIALVGMRNLRDYKEQVLSESKTLGSASPFNIVTKYINLRNFTKTEVAELYAQHTAETGQVFEPETVDFVFEQTQGQPWLVNAIAREAVEEITRKDYSIPITQSLAEQAIQNIIHARGTHTDSLMKRLKEPRVRKVILPLVQGEEDVDRQSDDFLYVKDLGLIKIDEKTRIVEPANPIYAEIIIRAVSMNVQEKLCADQTYQMPRYLKNGKMDIDHLLEDFQIFWRENSEVLWDTLHEEGLREYKEAAPHLVMQAFLQRVINGGAQIIREMALGKKRIDLCVVHDGHKYPIELKILQSQRSLGHSLKQTAEYMDKVGADTGWLVIFDRNTEKSWDEKIYMNKETVDGKTITVAGC